MNRPLPLDRCTWPDCDHECGILHGCDKTPVDKSVRHGSRLGFYIVIGTAIIIVGYLVKMFLL